MNSKNPVSQWFGVPKLSQRSKKYLGVFFVAILATTTVLIFPPNVTRGATFTFAQTSWLGGTDGGTRPSHPGNQTGWAKYDSKDAAVATSSEVSLALTNGTAVQTSSSDFGAGTASNVAVSGDVSLNNVSSTYAWQQNDTQPEKVYSSSGWMSSNKMLIYGGGDNSTWVFDPATDRITKLSTTGAPTARNNSTMVWDSTNNKYYLFGGFSGDNVLRSFDPVTNAWTQLTPTGTAPTARGDALGVWDSTNQKMYIFGGTLTNNTAVSELWSYTPATNAWAQLALSSTPPSIRSGAMGAWDAVNQKMYIVGGYNPALYGSGNGAYNNQIWSYAPATDTWTQLTPTGTAPSVKQEGAAVWSTTENVMYVFGGRNYYSSYNELNKYNPANNTWTKLNPTGTLPQLRSGTNMEFDSVRNQLIVFSGTNSYMSRGYSDIWKYDISSGSWTSSNFAPPATLAPASAMDSSGNAYSFSGLTQYGDGTSYFPGGMWKFSPSTGLWSKLSTINEPSGRRNSTMVWSTGTSKFYIFGGYIGNTLSGELWSFDPASNTWQQLTSHPSLTLYTHKAVWDAATSAMIVYGGFKNGGSIRNDETWSYSPSTNTWTQLASVGPGASVGLTAPYMASDGAGKIYLFGGNNGSNVNKTWAFDTSTNVWTELITTGTPTGRQNGASAWSPRLNKFFIYDGSQGSGVYSFNPTTNVWTQITPTGTALSARTSDVSMEWDEANSRFIAVGGSYSNAVTYINANVTFVSSGTLTSSVMDLGQKNFIGNLDFTSSVPAPTTLKFQLRSAATSGAVSSATWYGPTGASDYYTSTGTAINSVHNGDRYFQYKAFLDTSNTGYTPTLSDITINFTYYPSAGTLTSSAFNTNDSANAVTKIEWNATEPASTDVKFQVRTAPNSAGVPGTWGAWMGPDGTNGTYFTDATGAEAMPADVRDGSNDQWFQYKMFLSTTDGMATPSVAGVTTSYLVNSQPTVTNVTAAQGSNGAVAVTYDTDDGDNSTVAVSLGVNLGITLSGSIASGDATLLVSDAAKLPAAGSIFIDNEEISYASKSVNTLSGLVRARNNTYAAAHNDAAVVYLKATSVTGDVGSSVAIGTAKAIAWNVATDISNLNTSTAQVKVFVNDGSLANQISSASSANFNIDTTPPSTVSSTFLTRATAKSSSSMEISWTTDKASNSVVEYGTTLSYGLSAQDDALVTSHSVTLTGLTANTLYYFKVKSIDAVNNTVIDDNNGDGFTFITPEANGSSAQQNDTTAPVISAVSVKDVTTTSATVVWTTDEEASTIVNYGNSSAYGSLAGVPDIFTLTHTAILANLLPGTTYHFQIVSLDRSGNRAASANNTLTTQAGTGTGTGTGDGTGTSTTDQQLQDLLNQKAALDTQIAELQAQLAQSGGPDAQQRIDELRLQLAELQVKIDAANKMKAEYEAMKVERDQAVIRAEKAEAALSEITDKILGIKDGDSLSPAEMLKIVITKFQYFTRLFKSSATAEEKQQLEGDLNDTSTTLKDLASLVPPPKILTKPAIEVGADQAIISWSTDKATKGYVGYATDESFKQAKEYTLKAGSDELTKEHAVTLSGLMPATTYHYQVQSASESGASNESNDFTFTTKESAAVISAARMAKLSEKSAKVNWVTSIPASSMVTYTPIVAGAQKAEDAKTQGTPGLSKDHEVILEGLSAGTVYAVEIASTDIFGNTVNSKLGNLITAEDKTAPEIDQLRTETSIIPGAKNKIQVFVTWKTSEPATSQVVFTKGSANANSKFDGQSQDNDELTYNHTAVITNWDPGALYSFKAVSKDEFGNIGYSKIYVVLTPKPKATIVDVILDNFASTFGWTKKIGQ